MCDVETFSQFVGDNLNFEVDDAINVFHSCFSTRSTPALFNETAMFNRHDFMLVAE